MKHVLIVFTGFNEVNILSLAEVACLFVGYKLITCIYQNPLAIAQYLRRIAKTSDTNPTSSEHILVQIVRGQRNDLEYVVLNLITKVAQIGAQQRAELLCPSKPPPSTLLRRSSVASDTTSKLGSLY